MLKILWTRIRQGHRTIPFPRKEPTLPERFRGRPVLDSSKCREGCQACVESCPTQAITLTQKNTLQLDLGRCLFCNDCTDACPEGAITYSNDYRLSVRERKDLILDSKAFKLAEALNKESLRIFGRSLKLRQVSAGGCNGCEVEVNVLSTVVFDLGRFGIQIVASPRHADGLIITGPVTQNMKLALQKTYAAVPAPKLVIAVGSCAISGGPYIDHTQVNNGVDGILPVDLYIPGCPPHPITILDGLLRLLAKRPD